MEAFCSTLKPQLRCLASTIPVHDQRGHDAQFAIHGAHSRNIPGTMYAINMSYCVD